MFAQLNHLDKQNAIIFVTQYNTVKTFRQYQKQLHAFYKIVLTKIVTL